MSPQPETPVHPQRLGWHPTDPVSLVAGLLAVAIALVAVLDLDVDGSVVVPVALVVAGVAGLLASVRDRS